MRYIRGRDQPRTDIRSEVAVCRHADCRNPSDWKVLAHQFRDCDPSQQGLDPDGNFPTYLCDGCYRSWVLQLDEMLRDFQRHLPVACGCGRLVGDADDLILHAEPWP